MNGKQILEAAVYCVVEPHETCDACPMVYDCLDADNDVEIIAESILAVRDHVAAETRKQVIAELREWAKEQPLLGFSKWDVIDKLDSMEDKDDGQTND